MDDVHEITRRVYEYAWGIDTRDWDLYRSIFTDQIEMTFTSYNGEPGAVMSADEWVARVKPLFVGLDATQHVMTNPLVDVDGDRGRCRMYVEAEHFFAAGAGDGSFVLGGYYDDALVRTEQGWRIQAVTLHVTWERGNRDIMAPAAEMGGRRLKAEI